MREGLLWYDADPRRTPQARVDEALQRYRERFGTAANVCHVAPAEVFVHPDVAVVGDPAVLPHHFVVGVDEARVDASSVRRARPTRPSPGAIAKPPAEAPTVRSARSLRRPTPVAPLVENSAVAREARQNVAVAGARAERGRRQPRSA